MHYYPYLAPTLNTLKVPFRFLWCEGCTMPFTGYWFVNFLRDSQETATFSPMEHQYAAAARYRAGLRHPTDPLAKELDAAEYLQKRLKDFESFDAVVAQSLALPVAIRHDGRIEMLDGHHRASMMLARGLTWITADVKYVSPTWQRLVADLRAILGKDWIYSPINHPWFDDWGTMRESTGGRETMVIAAVETIRSGIPSGLWFDVGCCTGHLARTAEAANWTVIGFDSEELFIRVAETVSPALGSHVTYYCTAQFQDIIGSDSDGSIGCVSVLSILHHWLRDGGDVRYTDAVRLIADKAWCFVIDMDVPANGLVDQAKTTIPLEQDKYADWLRTTIGCSLVRYIGTADLGRPIFLCSKRLSS